MVSDAVVGDGVAVAVAVLDGFLPLAEAVQRLPSVVVDLQRRLETRGTREHSDQTNTELPLHLGD